MPTVRRVRRVAHAHIGTISRQRRLSKKKKKDHVLTRAPCTNLRGQRDPRSAAPDGSVEHMCRLYCMREAVIHTGRVPLLRLPTPRSCACSAACACQSGHALASLRCGLY